MDTTKVIKRNDMSRCPVCCSCYVVGDSIDFEGDSVLQYCRCEECGSKWVDVYEPCETTILVDNATQIWFDPYTGVLTRE